MSEVKTDAWMPLWIGAYLADTQHLTRDEHGGYLLLLMAYWRARTALPDDDKRLAAIAKATSAEWRRLRPTLAEFFTTADGVWWHKRVEAEIDNADKRKVSAVSKAQAGGQALAEKRRKQSASTASSTASSTPQALLDDVLGECPTPSPIPDLPSVDHSEAIASDAVVVLAEEPKLVDQGEIIFGYGVPMLASAGSTDKHARSFLAGLRKGHGDALLIDALRSCAKAKPLQPLEWLAAALPPQGSGRHAGFSAKNYREGVTADGSL